ncbi:MAG: hypothetical protein JO271_08555 [Verrucomicrobia bacterium]|nr:hypothetical protein [Verrucomicrobiota bacterium]
MWKSLLVIYRQVDVTVRTWLLRTRFVHTLSEGEVDDATESFRQFPGLVRELTQGLAAIKPEIVSADRPLTSLTPMGQGKYWPSPADTRPELDALAPVGRYASIFVLWPQNNLETGRTIQSAGWGLALAASDWSNQATYVTVANAESAIWKVPRIGEVWLHEWLHGVCAFYARLGYTMPSGDADGGERHGYKRSPENGWTEYYRDLMSGNVVESGCRVGIPLDAWRGPNSPEAGLDDK